MASIDEANSQTAMLLAVLIQYRMKFMLVQVRWLGGTGSISLLLREPDGANVDGSGLSSHVSRFPSASSREHNLGVIMASRGSAEPFWAFKRCIT